MDVNKAGIKKICEKFILCEYGAAHHDLVSLTEWLIKNNHMLFEIPGMTELMTKIVEAQERKNYPYLADLLGYELLVLLE